MKNLIRKIFSALGLIILKKPKDISHLHNNLDDFFKSFISKSLKFRTIKEAQHDYEIIKDYTMVPFDNLASLYNQVQYIEESNLEGDFVECGVWKGGSIGMMALANKKYGIKARNLHLFDSFKDICKPDPDLDGERAMKESIKYLQNNTSLIKDDGLQPMTGFYDSFGGHGTMELCNALLVDKIGYPKEFIHFYPGWFQETFPKYASSIKSISLLRMDSDWYASTKLTLEYFFDRVVDGGIIIIDDYGTYDGCKKAVDEFLSERGINKMLNNSSSFNDECFYIIK